jgi:hypothetical protein
VLYVGSQLVSSVMSTASMDKNQRYLLLGLPFFFVPFIWSFPAGLLVYWITTNTWTIAQQPSSRSGWGRCARRPTIRRRARSRPWSALQGRRRGRQGAGEEAGRGGRRGRLRRSWRARAPKSRRPARRRLATQEEEAIREAPMTDDEDMEPIDRVQDLLRRSPMRWISTAEVEVEERDGVIRGTLIGDDLGLFIGRHGQTIDAVQHLAFKAAGRGTPPVPARGGRRRGLPRPVASRCSTVRRTRRSPTRCAAAGRRRSTR